MPALPDSFETLRDCRALFLKHLGALLQDCNVLSSSAIQAIQQGAGSYFDEMVASRKRDSFQEEVDGLTASRITLVGADDLELDIRLDNLSARLYEHSGSNLWKIHLRFVTLLRRPDLARTDNPVGPRGIRQGLNEMFVAAGAIGLDKKLDLLERIENSLLQNLPALYAEINDFLDRAGVDAAQPVIVGAPDSKTKPAESSEEAGNGLQALQQTVLSQLPGLPGQGGAAASLLSQAAMERLIFRLNELEQHGKLTPSLRPGTSPSLEALIPGLFSEAEASRPGQPKLLNSSELGIPASAPEGLAIDTLARIFEAIFANPALPDALKAVLSSLQITVLKRAMQDADFFATTSNPTRRLVDRMALAVLGLPLDVPARHPVCARLFEIAARLRSASPGDAGTLAEAQAQVDALIAERNAAISRAADAYLPLLGMLDRRDKAAIQSRLALEQRLQQGVPGPIRSFLEQTWSRVLQQVWLEHGPDSSEWQSALTVIDNLLWTFQPKADSEERKALAKRLPEILQRLKAGMERIGVAAAKQATFLDDCFALQTRALRTAPGTEAPPETPPLEAGSLRRARGQPVAGEVQSGRLVLQTLDFSDPHATPNRALPCRPGDWLKIQLADGSSGIALFCHLSPASQRVLLCNPDFGLALAIHPAALDRQFREGEAANLSATSLFEAAARQALQRTAAR